MRFALALALSLVSGAANADGHNVPVDFTHSCNPIGAVIDVADGPRIYLGRSCDAVVEGYGEGRWWYAANGFWVDAPNFGLKFPGMDAPCGSLPYCQPR